MRTLVESLKRLYKDKRLSDAKVEELLKKGTITKDEYQYITE